MADEFAQDVLPRLHPQVQRHRLLVAALDQPVLGPGGPAVLRRAAPRVADAGLLDLDDLGAEVAAPRGAERPRAADASVEPPADRPQTPDPQPPTTADTTPTHHR